MKRESDKIKNLINIILDPKAEDHEKDDAAMDLADYDDTSALGALIEVARNPTKNDEFALFQYGETIGIYWIRDNLFHKNIFLSLNKEAQHGVISTLVHFKPEWIEEYQINKIN